MKINPFRIQYLRLVAEAEGRLEEGNIQQIGERIECVATAFELLPEFRGIRLDPPPNGAARRRKGQLDA